MRPFSLRIPCILSPFALRITYCSFASTTSASSSSPRVGQMWSGQNLRPKLIGKVQRAITRHQAHWTEVKPLTWTLTALPKNWVTRTWTTAMTIQTTQKDGLPMIPFKILNSSLIFLEQIMLKTCMNTKRLKTTERCLDGVSCSKALYIGFCSMF